MKWVGSCRRPEVGSEESGKSSPKHSIDGLFSTEVLNLECNSLFT
jgi:hypothetical protein